MKKEFSKTFMEENRGCYSIEELETCSFMQANSAEITIESILDSEIPVKDKYWFVINKCSVSKRDIQELSISIALTVIHIYENKYPYDKRPREAIEAAKQYLDVSITLQELSQKRAAAAYAAYAAAAYAAYAAVAYAAVALLKNLKEFVKAQYND